MANYLISLPLYQRISRKNTIPRTVELIILFLLFSLLVYRLLSLTNHGITWLLAFFCESWFTFVWLLTVNTKWNQVDYKTHPDRLLQWVPELPPVDMFVTTADPVLEPPIITVNTVLSLLAVDYPAHKLACYVSDDGVSPLTFYSLVEASKFAKLWVPFCKKYNIHVRAPFRYFSGKPLLSQDVSLEFQQEWRKMKDEYEHLSQKIEDAAKKSVSCDFADKFDVFSNIERRNHPTIIKDADSSGLPHLVYISREKRPKHPHHFKAGAMNVLTRVSGVMTNAPFMLNVDCDMFINNPQIILHAMCLLLGVKNGMDSAFVQSPQKFYDGLKDDPYGNQLVVLFEYLGRGVVGIQGPFYAGTGCFHRRKVIYGLSPDDKEITGKLSDEDYLQNQYGNSKVFTKSAAQTLSGLDGKTSSPHLWSSVEAANIVADCGYEYGTSWGIKVGWIYGSTTEDILTGLTIHKRGWRSAYCSLDPPGFLGCAPSGGPAAMTQQKRWATGLLEILLSSRSPIFATLYGKLEFRQCLAYMWILVWPLRSIPELCYAALPAYCIITNSHFLPKVQEPAILIHVALFVIYNLYTLSEYLRTGLSIRAWWNNQRMWRVTSMTAWLFGMLSVILKLLGLSETVFEVTKKDQTTTSDDSNANAGTFTFDESPFFVPGTTILLVNLTALAIGLLGFRPTSRGGDGSGIGEFLCSVCVIDTMLAFFLKPPFFFNSIEKASKSWRRQSVNDSAANNGGGAGHAPSEK
ncbi:hypothetical protein F0562_011141 [Nyssa sinensis]|uniref:Cellulose synthase-like protein H1 n=1 Tax=Nyssa sinensis TaxID=561372 RepID=A0A5J5A404_9ASTE|nr:hypothetical protein F0562_011141 [Nyssa sinensis]